MTCNVFGWTLNLTQPNPSRSSYLPTYSDLSVGSSDLIIQYTAFILERFVLLLPLLLLLLVNPRRLIFKMTCCAETVRKTDTTYLMRACIRRVAYSARHQN